MATPRLQDYVKCKDCTHSENIHHTGPCLAYKCRCKGFVK